jgi:acetyl esterase/lipase
MDDRAQVADDGCKYMTEEEVSAFMKQAMPGIFQRDSVKNRLLDLQYGTLPAQLLDVYYPDDKAAGGGPYPVIFFIHGGAWMLGSRDSGTIRGIIGALKHGYAVIAVEYRLYPQVKFPEFIFDIKTAVRWARANAELYGFDPDRFGMIGDSAGAYNALMVAFTTGHPEYEGALYGWEGRSDMLHAVCAQYGTSDLSVDKKTYYRQSGVKRFRRDAPGQPGLYEQIWCTDNPGLLRMCSPISFVSPDIPPVLLMHGLSDGEVPYQNSVLLKDRIQAVCGKDRVRLLLFEGLNHSDPFFCSEKSTDLILDFFNQYLL